MRLCMALRCLLNIIGKPVETLVETITRGGTGGLDVLVEKTTLEHVISWECTTLVAKYKEYAGDNKNVPRHVVSGCGDPACR